MYRVGGVIYPMGELVDELKRETVMMLIGYGIFDTKP